MRLSIVTRTADLFRSHGLTTKTIQDFDAEERAEIARRVFRVLYAEYTFDEVKRMIETKSASIASMLCIGGRASAKRRAYRG